MRPLTERDSGKPGGWGEGDPPQPHRNPGGHVGGPPIYWGAGFSIKVCLRQMSLICVVQCPVFGGP